MPPEFPILIDISAQLFSLLPSAITAAGFRHGLDLEVFEAPYNQIVQEAHDPASATNRFNPDIVMVLSGPQTLGFHDRVVHSDAAAAVDAALGTVRSLRDCFSRHSRAICIWPNLPRNGFGVFGHMEAGLPGAPAWQTEHYNIALAQWLNTEADLLFDLAGLVAVVGTDRWRDEKLWRVAKLPFNTRCIPLFADHVARLIAAHSGMSRRALILDLDNTLWHGVIGDDGLEGINLDEGDPIGESYLEVQRMALRLKQRGVVLCVCSKNDSNIAREPFRHHPAMLLKEDDFAVFMANWTDKAHNVVSIAERLSLGLDSLVFVDDNPAERLRVREAHPGVAVPELPDDPALFASTLLAAGYFETTVLSAEDENRADFYKANAERAELQVEIGSTKDFLRSLQMTAWVGTPSDLSFRRVAQLVAKSNQFNLTTRRHDETRLRRFADDPNQELIQVRLEDRFGDNGIVAVLHLCKNVNVLEIETWVMSCRVLGRMLEDTIVEILTREAQDMGCDRLRGEYLATSRNGLVADLYKRLGFTEAGHAGESRLWELLLADYDAPVLPIMVKADRPGPRNKTQ